MVENGDDHLDAEHGADDPTEGETAGYDAAEQHRCAADQERHRRDARAFFDATPPYRIQFEENGTASLCKKRYDYWPNRAPEVATRWRIISNHSDLDEAERRLRLITSPHIYYDEHGRLAQAPPAMTADRAAPRRTEG